MRSLDDWVRICPRCESAAIKSNPWYGLLVVYSCEKCGWSGRSPLEVRRGLVLKIGKRRAKKTRR